MNLMNGHMMRYLAAIDAEQRFLNIITINDIFRQVIAEKKEVFDNHITSSLLDSTEESRIY